MSLSSRLKRGVSGFVEGFVFGVRSVEEQNVEHEVNKPTEDISKEAEITALKEEIDKWKIKAFYGYAGKIALDSAIQELNNTKTFSIKTTESVAEGAAAADSFFEVVRTVITEVLGYEKFDDDFAYALEKLLDFAKEREPKGDSPLSKEEMKEVVSELVLVVDPNFDKPRHQFQPSITQNLTEEDKAEYNRLLTEKRVATGNQPELRKRRTLAENVKILEDAINLGDKAIQELESLTKTQEIFEKKGIVAPKGNGPIFKDYNIELKAMLDNGAPQEEVSALQEFIEDGVESSMPGKVTPPVPVPEGFVKESPPLPPAEFFTEEEKELLNVKFHETVEDIKALVEKERARKEKKAAGRRARYNEAIQRFKKARKALGVKLNNS